MHLIALRINAGHFEDFGAWSFRKPQLCINGSWGNIQKWDITHWTCTSSSLLEYRHFQLSTDWIFLSLSTFWTKVWITNRTENNGWREGCLENQACLATQSHDSPGGIRHKSPREACIDPDQSVFRQHCGYAELMWSGLIEDQAWSSGHNEENWCRMSDHWSSISPQSKTKWMKPCLYLDEYLRVMEMYTLTHTFKAYISGMTPCWL